jgi:hypothetical protein
MTTLLDIVGFDVTQPWFVYLALVFPTCGLDVNIEPYDNLYRTSKSLRKLLRSYKHWCNVCAPHEENRASNDRNDV